MRIFIFFLLCVTSVFSESFITDFEYGAMLYKNPRGIGCDKCHGEKGQGGLIAKYEEYNRTSEKYYPKELIAPPIHKASLQELADGITNPKDVMPNYFLTQNEIIILYKYLKEINKEKK